MCLFKLGGHLTLIRVGIVILTTLKYTDIIGRRLLKIFLFLQGLTADVESPYLTSKCSLSYKPLTSGHYHCECLEGFTLKDQHSSSKSLLYVTFRHKRSFK